MVCNWNFVKIISLLYYNSFHWRVLVQLIFLKVYLLSQVLLRYLFLTIKTISVSNRKMLEKLLLLFCKIIQVLRGFLRNVQILSIILWDILTFSRVTIRVKKSLKIHITVWKSTKFYTNVSLGIHMARMFLIKHYKNMQQKQYLIKH